MYEQQGYQEGQEQQGATTPGAEAGPGEYYYPPAPTYATPMPGASSSTTFLLIIVGVLLLLVGWMVSTAIYHVDDEDALKLVVTLVDIFIYLGVAVLSIGLFHGAFRDQTMPDMVRTGMIIGAALIIGFTAAYGGSLASILRYYW